MSVKFTNNAVAALAASVTTTSLSLSVQPGAGVLFPALAEGDTIKSAQAAVVQGDSMVGVVLTQVSGDTVKVWLVDGVSGKTATVMVTATTTENRIKQVEFQIRVKD